MFKTAISSKKKKKKNSRKQSTQWWLADFIAVIHGKPSIFSNIWSFVPAGVKKQ